MILAVDTALGACSAALVAEGRTLAHEHREMARGHAEALAPMVDALMRGAGVPFAALDRMAVTTGPNHPAAAAAQSLRLPRSLCFAFAISTDAGGSAPNDSIAPYLPPAWQ